MPATIEKESTLTAVDYFSAKLQYEATPWGLKNASNPGEFFMIDVRDAEAFAKEHIPGAKSVPLAELPKKLSTLPKDKTIVTYCWHHDCASAAKAALELARNGFAVKDLCGGIKAWKDAGFEVEGRK